jgi:hypothetical protein
MDLPFGIVPNPPLLANSSRIDDGVFNFWAQNLSFYSQKLSPPPPLSCWGWSTKPSVRGVHNTIRINGIHSYGAHIMTPICYFNLCVCKQRFILVCSDSAARENFCDSPSTGNWISSRWEISLLRRLSLSLLRGREIAKMG